LKDVFNEGRTLNDYFDLSKLNLA